MKGLLFAFGLLFLLGDVYLYTVVDPHGNQSQLDETKVPPFPSGPSDDDTDQIVGGSIVSSIKSFPFMAALSLNGGLCGGTLYNSSYIITAAHCVYGQSQANAANFKVFLNSTALRETPGRITVGVRKFIIHPQYNSISQNNDVAILALKNKVNLPSVALPAVASTATYAGNDATIVGWGTTSSDGSISYDLRQASVIVWNNTFCGTRYGTGTNGINSLKLCAGSAGKDTCQGDSGGPLLISGVQIGITSYGIGCADKYYPGVYARVTALANWIRATVPKL